MGADVSKGVGGGGGSGSSVGVRRPTSASINHNQSTTPTTQANIQQANTNGQTSQPRRPSPPTLQQQRSPIHSAPSVSSPLSSSLSPSNPFVSPPLSDVPLPPAGSRPHWTVNGELRIPPLLEVLNLSKQGLGPTEARAMVRALQANKSVRVINLAHNQLGNAGAEIISHLLLRDVTIESLDLLNNDITDRGVRHLTRSIGANPRLRLTELFLGFNRITDEGCHLIFASLKNNATIMTVDLTGNTHISPHAWHMMNCIRSRPEITARRKIVNGATPSSSSSTSPTSSLSHDLQQPQPHRSQSTPNASLLHPSSSSHSVTPPPLSTLSTASQPRTKRAAATQQELISHERALEIELDEAIARWRQLPDSEVSEKLLADVFLLLQHDDQRMARFVELSVNFKQGSIPISAFYTYALESLTYTGCVRLLPLMIAVLYTAPDKALQLKRAHLEYQGVKALLSDSKSPVDATKSSDPPGLERSPDDSSALDVLRTTDASIVSPSSTASSALSPLSPNLESPTAMVREDVRPPELNFAPNIDVKTMAPTVRSATPPPATTPAPTSISPPAIHSSSDPSPPGVVFAPKPSSSTGLGNPFADASSNPFDVAPTISTNPFDAPSTNPFDENFVSPSPPLPSSSLSTSPTKSNRSTPSQSPSPSLSSPSQLRAAIAAEREEMLRQEREVAAAEAAAANITRSRRDVESAKRAEAESLARAAFAKDAARKQLALDGVREHASKELARRQAAEQAAREKALLKEAAKRRVEEEAAKREAEKEAKIAAEAAEANERQLAQEKADQEEAERQKQLAAEVAAKEAKDRELQLQAELERQQTRQRLEAERIAAAEEEEKCRLAELERAKRREEKKRAQAEAEAEAEAEAVRLAAEQEAAAAAAAVADSSAIAAAAEVARAEEERHALAAAELAASEKAARKAEKARRKAEEKQAKEAAAEAERKAEEERLEQERRIKEQEKEAKRIRKEEKRAKKAAKEEKRAAEESAASSGSSSIPTPPPSIYSSIMTPTTTPSNASNSVGASIPIVDEASATVAVSNWSQRYTAQLPLIHLPPMPPPIPELSNAASNRFIPYEDEVKLKRQEAAQRQKIVLLHQQYIQAQADAAKRDRDQALIKPDIIPLLLNLHTIFPSLDHPSESYPFSIALAASDRSSSAVKKAYLKATITVHPDKQAGAAAERILLSKAIFPVLQASYQHYTNVNKT